MLEKLDTVGWSGLTHAFGTAEEIPAFITALRAEDPQVRGDARDELWTSLLHEGRRYEADVYAVPFLADLATDPATYDRAAIVDLLTAMAIGSDHPYLLTGFPIERLRPTPDAVDESWHLLHSEWSGRAVGEPRMPGEADELRVYDAVRAELPRIAALLDDTDGDVIEAAAYLLAWFPEAAHDTVVPLLAVAGHHDWRRDLRVTALLAAGLAARGPVPESAVITSLAHDGDEEVRWAAAVAWTLTAGTAVPEDPRAVLRARAGAGIGPDEPVLAPWGMGRAEWSVRLLEHLGDPGAADARAALVRAEATRRPHGPWAERLGEAFYLAFGDDERASPAGYAELTAAQRWLVDHLVRHPDALIAEPDEVTELLRWHGLPDSHPALTAYAA
ncbi:hypothetical protein Cme02nite_38890 [Catellatospora methionotrophica]|uniref:HEAT repeat protein n=1 Tax=Catellatospora methionotrophica TaxID=121620 RepID=A0A8J3PFT7_9ACTN|nr:hypothetical protein [Catellatospora methionotrophica]GIG15557.1 hypothetical protein Cme02nite_38890 [Catellatospora methionotrophica]